MNNDMRRNRGRHRHGAIWLVGIGTGIAGAAALIIAVTGVASGTQTPIPQAKLARIDALQARLAKEKSEHRVKPSGAAGLRAAKAASVAVQRRSAGITAMHQGPFPASSFEVRNFYQGPARGTWLLVYAGATTNPSTGAVGGGALNVYAEPQVGGPLTAVGKFQAPAGTGALAVLAAKGERLTLRSSQGDELTFSLATLKFTS